MKNLFIVMFTCLLFCSCGNKDKLQWEYCVIQLEGSQTPRVYAACEAEALKKASVYKPLYMPETDDLMMVLNNCGQDGWELVGIYTTTETVFPNMGDEQYHTGIKENTRTQSVNFVFKRIKDK